MFYFLTVNYYSTNLLTKLINSLGSIQNIDYKIIIINNSPQDESIYQLKAESVLLLESGDNIGFGNACNLGLKFIYNQCPQAIVWIINPDAYLPENSLNKVKLFFESYPELSIVGSIIHVPTSEIWFAGGRFISKTGAIITQDLLTDIDTPYVTCDWVSGCSLIINLQKFTECPLFNPAYFLYYEDFDFCIRYAKQGHLIAVTKEFSVVHQPSSITNKNLFSKFKHSTYSYLLTLENHTNKIVLILRLIRITCYASILIFIKPQVGFGKIYGVLIYWKRSRNF